ncbi:MAG TPA: hypothetical protein VK824_10245, partial [Planctomycetota bacterium]|nr:hypothetical protein [Planctomycetota bacterium]
MTPLVRKLPGPRGRAGALLLAAACAALATAALVEIARDRRALAVLMPLATPCWLAVLAGSVAAAAAALLLAARALRRPADQAGPWLPWRVAACVLVAGMAVHVLLLQPYRAPIAHATLGACGGLVALLMLAGRRLAAALPPRALSVADLAA